MCYGQGLDQISMFSKVVSHRRIYKQKATHHHVNLPGVKIVEGDIGTCCRRLIKNQQVRILN